MILNLKDINGHDVYVDDSSLFEAIADLRSGGITVFGMSLNTIRELRHEYMRRGGHAMATVESVREVFR